MVVNGAPVHGLLHPEAGHACVPRYPNDTFEGHNPSLNCPGWAEVEAMCASGALAKRAGLRDASGLKDLPDDHPVWDVAAHYLAALCALDEVAGRARQVLIARKVLRRDEDDVPETPLQAAARESLLLEAELRLNLAQACLTCGDAAAALGACDAYFALKDAPESNARDAKAHFRAARALEALDRLQEAEGHLRDAAAAAPDDRGVASALRRVRAARAAKRKHVPKASFRGVLLS